MTVEGDDLVVVVGGDVVCPSEVRDPGLCMDLMSMALPLPRPSPGPGGPFPPGGTEDILNVCGGELFPNPDAMTKCRAVDRPSPSKLKWRLTSKIFQFDVRARARVPRD